MTHFICGINILSDVMSKRSYSGSAVWSFYECDLSYFDCDLPFVQKLTHLLFKNGSFKIWDHHTVTFKDVDIPLHIQSYLLLLPDTI